MGDFGDLGQKMGDVRTEFQVPKGHGFDPVTEPKYAVTPTSDTDQHDYLLAAPPEWTRDAYAPCMPPKSWPLLAKLEHWEAWDEPTKKTDAASLCAGCPVLDQCRQDAMTQEAGLTAQNRYTVRGGWTPHQRAAYDRVAITWIGGQCHKGHPKVIGKDCTQCLKEKRARRDGYTTCPACLKRLKKSSLGSHRRRFHRASQEEAA